MESDFFYENGHNPMKNIRSGLLEGGDPFFVLADFDSYCSMQEKIEKIYENQRAWAQKALLNTARLGYFSSDRTIKDYVEDIWKL